MKSLNFKNPDFPFLKPTLNDLSKRRGVYGVGVNDADYVVQPTVSGIKYVCPYYSVWNGMMRRGYCEKLKRRNKTYRDVRVCGEWLTFSVFRSWMEKQDWEGKELDKDLLSRDGKIYSPETCRFIKSSLNKLLNSQLSSRGKYKQGVCYHKKSGKLSSAVRFNSKVQHLGLFVSESDAFSAYALRKSEIIIGEAEKINDPKIKAALYEKAKELVDESNIFKGCNNEN